MADPRHALGDWAENLAAEHLAAQGMEIVERNARTKVGEIDLVAADGETLVFVEVRSRTDPDQVHPAETVTRRKQLQVVRAAMAYCLEHSIQDRMLRFDVVAVLGVDGQLEHYPNAFEAGR